MKTQVLRYSLCLMALALLSMGTAFSQAPIIRQSYDSNTLGTGMVVYNTGYSTTDYLAAVAGFTAGPGEMSPGNSALGMLFVKMIESEGTWYVNADFRSVNYHENWAVDVIFIDRRFANGEIIKGDGTITDIGGTFTRLAGHDLILGADDGRSIGSKTGQRALTHGFNDELIINVEGDFEGGAVIQSKLTVEGSNLQVNSNPTEGLFSAIGTSGSTDPIKQNYYGFSARKGLGLAANFTVDRGAANEALIDYTGNRFAIYQTLNDANRTRVDRFVIDGEGQIGVGTMNADAILHLADDNVAAGARMLQLGDDVYFTDIDQGNTIGLYGVQDANTATLKLGSGGATLVGESSGRMVIKGNLHVEGSLTTGSSARSASSDEALANLHTELEALRQQNQVLAERVAALERATAMPEGPQSLDIAAATLAQNYPNPFTEVTTIGYQLPEGTQQATLYVYDMNGRQLLARTDLAGQSEVEIQGGKLTAGMYYYSLVVDGKVLDTKRMLLTQ